MIRGAINVGTHWNSLHGSFWDKVGQGALYFGTGAVQGGLAVLGLAGWAAGGAFAGAANAAIGGANGSQIFQQGIVGGFSGLAGGAFGRWAGQNLGGVVLNGFHVSANSAIGGAVNGAFAGGHNAVRGQISHEMGHYINNVNWDNGVVGGNVTNKNFINTNNNMYVTNGQSDGMMGYHWSIGYSGKYHISPRYMMNNTYFRPGSSLGLNVTNPFRSAAWHNDIWTKWFNLVPSRF